MKKVVPTDAVLVPDKAKCVFEGVIYDVYQWPQEQFDKTQVTFEMLRRPDTVATICVTDNKLLVLQEEQPHSGSRMSFPTGRVDTTDVSTLQAAQREVHEETGYSFKNWKLVKVQQPHAKIEWFIYTYIAWGTSQRDNPHVDPGEKIQVKEFNFDKAKDWSVHPHPKSYMGECRDIFEQVDNIEELQALSEFIGQEVDR